MAGFMPCCRGRMGWQRDVYLGRLRAVLVSGHGIAQTIGPSTGSARVSTVPGSARVKCCKAVDTSKNAADLFGAEEAVLDRQAGGAETETGLEQGEVGGQGGNVCEGGLVRGKWQRNKEGALDYTFEVGVRVKLNCDEVSREDGGGYARKRCTCERFVVDDHANDGRCNGAVKEVSSHAFSASNFKTYTAPSPNTPVMANLRRVGKWSFQI